MSGKSIRASSIAFLFGFIILAGVACGGGGSTLETVVVEPRLVDCVGVVPQRCMVVDGEYFYGAIEGFTYEEGYTYTLEVRIEELPEDEVPADGSSLKYYLVRQVSKVAEPPQSTSLQTGKASIDLNVTANTDTDFKGPTKKVTVFNIPIYAFAGVSDTKMKHAATVMAEYLDNNEDGTVDNPAVVAAMMDNNAFLIMWSKESDRENFDFPRNYIGQDLGAPETIPEWHTIEPANQFDATLEEVLHLITSAGYAYAYPDVFGERRGTLLANAMDIARGGYFEKTPSSYPEGAWYSYDDTTCDYACMVTEYFYWSLTSLLGAQNARADDIGEEWRAHTPALLKSKDMAAYMLLTNAEYRLPNTLPNGVYSR